MRALNWPALSKWSNEYLIGKFGQAVVHADATSNGRTVQSTGTHIHKGTRVIMTWHEYLQSVMKQERGSNNNDIEVFYALDGKPMTKSYPYLAVDVSDPGLLSVGVDMFQFQSYTTNLWVSNYKETGFHYDASENLLGMVRGTKEVVILDPLQIQRINLANQRQVHPGVLGPTIVKWEKVYSPTQLDQLLALGVRYTKCIVSAGDMIYIPKMHCHHVTSVGDDAKLNMAVNFWYKSHGAMGGFFEKLYTAYMSRIDMNAVK